MFKCDNADHLYDSPIMYCLPDTATVKVGKATVLIAVYSPHKMATAMLHCTKPRKISAGSKGLPWRKLP
jgi:hypothetical protein